MINAKPKDTGLDVELASGFTVANYFAAAANCDRSSIADAIHRRFTERYLDPVSSQPRHGFAMMAVACLMIEALESFRQGWADTSQQGQGEHAFCSFFDTHDAFAPFRGHAHEFRKSVRCGILHQAETAAGWRIQRKGALLSVASGAHTINATLFIKGLTSVLDAYRNQLKAAQWDDEVWRCLRAKMKQVCATTNKKLSAASLVLSSRTQGVIWRAP